MTIERRFIWTFTLFGLVLLLGCFAVVSILGSNRASVVSTAIALERAKSLQAILAVVRDFKAATLAQTITRRRPQELQAQKLHAELTSQLDAKESLAPEMIQTIRPLIAEHIKQMSIISDEMSGSNRNRGVNLYTNDASKREQKIIELVEKTVSDAAQSAENEVRGLQSMQEYLQATIVSVGLVIVALILGIVVAARRVLKDFRRMIDVMQQVADGADETELPFRARKDEIGHMSRALEAFCRAAAERRQLEIRASYEEEQRKQALLGGLSEQFEQKIDRVVLDINASSSQILALVQDMESRVSGVAARVDFVSSLSTEALTSSVGLSAVASGITASVRRISETVQDSTALTTNVACEARDASGRAETLAANARIIQDFTKSITSIAQQTNLLALNAAIEAARAGAAGRGFSVVAAEVKALALQTAQATNEITSQIDRILLDTDNVVSAIGAIETAVAALGEHNSVISQVVSEQRNASGAIVRFTDGTAANCDRVNMQLTEITAIIAETGEATRKVVTAASGLSEEAERLTIDAKTFIDGVRAA